MLILGLVVLVAWLLRNKKLKEKVYHTLKNDIFYAFMLEENLGFMFSLVLNAHIMIFDVVTLSILKFVALVILLVYMCWFGSILILRDQKKNPFNNAKHLHEKWTYILSETVEEKYSENFLRLNIVHDILMAFCIVSGTFASPVQMYLWAGVELLLTVLLLKFRVFKDRLMQVRQIVVESVFAMLCIVMAIVATTQRTDVIYSMIIYITYFCVMCFEVLLMIATFVRAIYFFVKKIIDARRNKVKNQQELKSAELKSSTDNKTDYPKTASVGGSMKILPKRIKRVPEEFSNFSPVVRVLQNNNLLSSNSTSPVFNSMISPDTNNPPPPKQHFPSKRILQQKKLQNIDLSSLESSQRDSLFTQNNNTNNVPHKKST